MPWETVGSLIRYRVRDPKDFQDGSFRAITIKKAKPRVYAVVGKLIGETTMTVQALRFPVDDGWTVESAKDWVKNHFTKSLKEFNAMSNQRETKDFRFEVKELTEAGQFTGYASVYGVVDQQGDIVEKGAFTKTIKEKGAQVPILWQHNTDEPIGMGALTDTESGLMINGQLELDLPEAAKTYVRLKKGLAKGLSIGYRVITDTLKDGKRLLKEIKLYEVSLVLIPANELAVVTSVKADEPPADEEEFSKALTVIEQKAGRMISAANRSRIEQCISVLQALLAADDSSAPGKGAASGVSEEPHGKDSDGPVIDHSTLEQFISKLRSRR